MFSKSPKPPVKCPKYDPIKWQWLDENRTTKSY